MQPNRPVGTGLDGQSATLAVSQASRAARLAEIEERRFARALHVPTDDAEVRQLLLERNAPLDEPNEDAHDRRERLRAILAREALDAGASAPPPPPPNPQHQQDSEMAAMSDGGDEDYYTEGTLSLMELRTRVATASISSVAKRLAAERSEHEEEAGGPMRSFRTEAEADCIKRVRETVLKTSQRAEGRPLSAVALGGQVVVTGSWGGNVSFWDAETCELKHTLQAHESRISMLEMPVAGVVLTAAADSGSALLRTMDNGEIGVAQTYKGHEGRVSAVRMHPHVGDLVVTTGFDGTIRVFNDGVPVAVHNSGHQQVTWANFHPDGGLLGTTGSEGGLRLWDMRSGRAVLTMEKMHVGQAVRVSFSGDGRTLASGGSDNSIAVTDLRKQRCVKKIAAHSKMISSLFFGGGVDGGDVLLSAGFDGTVKLWSVRRDFALIKAHTAHEDKVMAVDSASDLSMLVSACYDRSWKVWAP